MFLFKNYKEFRNYNILENLKIGKDVLNIIDKIDSPISNIILSLQKSNYIFRHNNIETSEKPTTIKFNNNQEIKIGRFLNKLKESILKQSNSLGLIKTVKNSFSEKNIQHFIKEYNRIILKDEFQNKKIPIKVIRGHGIYDVYCEIGTPGLGTLWNSCLINKKELLELYVKNMSKVGLATLWDGDNKNRKLRARALIWETDQGGRVMDRIYFTNSSDEDLFKQWAYKNNMYHKKNQNSYQTTKFENKNFF